MTAFTIEKTGTISVENGSTALIGDSTLLSVRACAGGLLLVGGTIGVIASVESDTGATLEQAWAGTTAEATTYVIVRATADAARLVNANDKLADLVNQLDGKFYFDYDAFGTVIGDRDAYDAETAGFRFALLSDGAPVLYVRTGASGTWTDGITIKGDTGPAGPAGTGDAYAVSWYDVGKPGAGEVLLVHVFASAVVFPTDMTGSRVAIEGANPTASAQYSLSKNGTEFATLTIGTDGTPIFAGETTFGAGSILRVIAPDPRDDTLSGVSVTLAGNRV